LEVLFLKQEKRQHKLNEEITAKKLMLIGVEGEVIGIVPINVAIEEAMKNGVDLVEMNSAEEGKDTVYKLMDYGKFIYQNKKNKKNNQVKTKEEKEVKFRPVTDVADLMTKVNKIKSMLKDGHSIKLNVVFKNREVVNMKNLGSEILNKVMVELSEVSRVKKEPHLFGKNIIAIIEPN